MFGFFVCKGYAGLRGPIAFALALALPKDIPAKFQMATTTMIVVWTTIFLLGSSIKLVVRLLRYVTEEWEMCLIFSKADRCGAVAGL